MVKTNKMDLKVTPDERDRLAIVEQRQLADEAILKRIEQSQGAIKDDVTEIKEDLRRIEDKIDELK